MKVMRMDRIPDVNASTMAFIGGPQPTLLYITRQSFGDRKHDRPIHSHDDLSELLLVTRGCGAFIADGRSYPLREGDIILANQDTPHEVLSASDEEIGTYCFGFCGLRFEGLPANYMLPPDSNPVCASGEYFSFLHELCRQAYRHLNGDVFERALSQSLATSFLLLAKSLKAACGDEECRPIGRDMPFRIRQYLDQHYTEPLTLRKIADVFGCSESYVSHACKQNTGYAPILYVIRRRIGLAQTLLTTTDASITHIAALAGYGDPNYFTRQFTEIVGISPSRYKAQYLESLRGLPRLP